MNRNPLNYCVKFLLVGIAAISLAACGGGGGGSNGSSGHHHHASDVRLNANFPESIEEGKTVEVNVALRYTDDLSIGSSDDVRTLSFTDINSNPNCTKKLLISPAELSLEVNGKGKTIKLTAPDQACKHIIDVQITGNNGKVELFNIQVTAPPTIPSAPMPNSNKASGSDVIYLNPDNESGWTSLKSVTIINNTDHMIYPVLRGNNSLSVVYKNQTYAKYDKHDPINREYRLYLGYEVPETKNYFGNDFYLGVKPHTTITWKNVPIAFWDSGQIVIFDKNPIPPVLLSDKKIPASDKAFDFNKNAKRYIWKQDVNTVGLLYSNKQALGFAPEAPAQLTEVTFRDDNALTFDINSGTYKPFKQIDNSGTQADYDVSYVNHLYLPVAMSGGPTHLSNDPSGYFGFTGSSKSVSQFQQALSTFYQDQKDQVWAKFDINPANDTGNVKLPGGYNIFGMYGQKTADNQQNLLVSKGQQDETAAVNDMTKRWRKWIPKEGAVSTPEAICQGSGDINFCLAFAKNMQIVYKAFASYCDQSKYHDYYLGNCQTHAQNPSIKLEDFDQLIFRNIIGGNFPLAMLNNWDTYIQQADVTQRLKCALRGVPPTGTKPFANEKLFPGRKGTISFCDVDVAKVKYPDRLYPDPGNIYSLDPYVHLADAVIGLTGYGFSLDDDIGNILAPGANHVYIAVGSIKGLPNDKTYLETLK